MGVPGIRLSRVEVNSWAVSLPVVLSICVGWDMLMMMEELFRMLLLSYDFWGVVVVFVFVTSCSSLQLHAAYLYSCLLLSQLTRFCENK